MWFAQASPCWLPTGTLSASNAFEPRMATGIDPRLNGLTGLAVTKLDVLGGLDSLNICTGYEYQGKTLDYFPGDLQILGDCKPIYETLPGWSEDISGVRNFNDLPENTKKYLKRIEEIVETPVQIISIGPARDETIVLENPLSE